MTFWYAQQMNGVEVPLSEGHEGEEPRVNGTTRTISRWAVGIAATAAVTGLPAGAANADETHRDSHNGSTFALIHTGQIDDPMEDVLEHTLLFGDGYAWD
ncbi:hypothetical protein [Streptomyces sp. NPDC056730]|uniref:hypothetical protein n=2 Tax=Streptomyces TaxID=1883 RepID=UPI00367FB5A2